MMRNTSRNATTFSGLAAMREDISRPLAWKKWKADVLDICFETPWLLTCLYSLADCEELFGIDVIVPLDPGDAVTENPAVLYNHKKRADKFEKYESDVKELRSHFLQLPADLLNPLQQRGSLRHCTVKMMFTAIDERLSELVQADYDSIESRLATMWDPSVDIEAFLSRKVALFEDLEDAGQPKASLEKVNIIIKCLPSIQFQRCVEAFFEKFVSVAKQTVKRLCKHVIQYATNVLPRATRGTALLAVGEQRVESSDEAIDRRVAAALEARLGPRAGAGDNKERRYCWTHGPCNHLSKDCFSPAIGHKIEATSAKKLGGAEEFTSYRKEKSSEERGKKRKKNA